MKKQTKCLVASTATGPHVAPKQGGWATMWSVVSVMDLIFALALDISVLYSYSHHIASKITTILLCHLTEARWPANSRTRGSELSVHILPDLHWASSFLARHLSLRAFHYTVPFSFCLNVCFLYRCQLFTKLTLCFRS